MDEELEIHKKRRHLPHWTAAGATYDLTFRTGGTTLSSQERQIVLAHIRSGDGRYYALLAVIIMPDHVHMILRPLGDVSLHRVMQGIKGVSARRVNEHRGVVGRIWQDESYDRIIRDQDDLERRLEYLRNNSIRVDLTDDAEEYPWWYFSPDACERG